MKTRFLAAVLAALQILVVSQNKALAWGDLGHETVGAIAEELLKQPGYEKGKALVFDILGAEPLSIAATFPDHVRDTQRYGDKEEKFGFDFAPYHFLTIPVGKQWQELTLSERPKKDADMFVTNGAKMLVQKTTTRDQKMILFRYYVHLVGDVHQPLHVGNPYDRGGNLCTINWAGPKAKQGYPHNLHSVWDSKIFDYDQEEFKKAHPEEWFGAEAFAKVILAEMSKLSASEIKAIANATPAQWYNESVALHSEVYPDKAPVKDPRDRTYCDIVDAHGKAMKRQKHGIPVADEAYVKKARALAHQRVLWAGIRLAASINRMAQATGTTAGLDADLKLLKSVLLTNDEGHNHVE